MFHQKENQITFTKDYPRMFFKSQVIITNNKCLIIHIFFHLNLNTLHTKWLMQEEERSKKKNTNKTQEVRKNTRWNQ